MAPLRGASLAGLLLPLAASLAGATLPKVPVFTFGEEGYPVFREPAIVLLPSGNLLAFIEGGQNHISDEADEATGYPNSNSAVVSKLSSDGGAVRCSLQPAVTCPPSRSSGSLTVENTIGRRGASSIWCSRTPRSRARSTTPYTSRWC